MNQVEQQLLRDIRLRIVECPIVVRWRSGDPQSGSRKGSRRDVGGVEFVAQTPYEPGDNFRDIDWATSSLPGSEIVVNRYRDFHPIKVFALVQVGTDMLFGTQRVTKRDLAAEVVGSAFTSTFKTQDTVSLIQFDDSRVVYYSPPGNPRHTLATGLSRMIRTDATDLRSGGAVGDAGVTNGGANGDRNGLVRAIAMLPRGERCLVFLICAYRALSDREKQALKFASSKHDLRFVMVQDLRERELPNGFGLYKLRSLNGSENRTIWLNNKARAQFKSEAWNHHSAMLDFFNNAGALTAVLSTEMDRASTSKILRRLFGGFSQRRETE
ncbi:MAG: DUF58 domain-containing protein [Cyanobacteria bacterium SZAS-4]|nr:DUF58 domain-containing protein [Cyanobacteria bacterium SZAS-4]